MIFGGFTASHIKILAVILILLLGLFLRLYKIDQAFPFDHDQEFVANSAYNFFVNRQLTLIGQELSFGGFFLGPLHNWISFIPYGLCNLVPDCVPYFYITIGVLTIAVLFLVIKKIFDLKTALVATVIYAISAVSIGFERGPSSNFFLFLSSIGLLFSTYQFFKGKSKYLIIGAFIAGLATVNFNPVFIFSSLAFFASSLLAKNKQLKIYLFAILAFLTSYLPLVIFNFRHESILARSLNKFVAQNAADSGVIEKLVYLVKSVIIPFYSNYLFQSTLPIFVAFTVVAITFGFYYLFKIREKSLLFLPIWMFIVLLGFTFYKGPIQDYYFTQTLLPLIILVSIFATRNLIFLIIFLLLFLFTNFRVAQNYSTIINYQIKKQAINYIISDTQDESFNVYFDLPMGFNTGYSYLFKAKGKLPQEGGENLYIVELASPQEFDLDRYQSTFSDKEIQRQAFGYLHVVSIK